VGKRAIGGYYILVGSVYLKKSESSVPGMKEHTYLHSEPAGKGLTNKKRKKEKTLVLTLGSPPEKGGKKKKEKNKNPGINPGQPAGKGRKKKKKNPWY
jgi:hypothetical protein